MWQTGIWEGKALPERQLTGIRKRNSLVLKWLGGIPGEKKKLPYGKAGGASGKGPAHSAEAHDIQMANS